MAKVFVSHSSADAALADEVHRWLITDGHEVFLDQNLRDGVQVGEDWQPRLFERLRWADAVVCLITSAYVKSTWCAAEVAIAHARGSRLLPVQAEPGVNGHPLLKAVQHADAATDMATARAKLAEVLRRLDAVGGAGWPDDRPPYPGLRPFDTDQHRVFFGRTREVEQLATVLRSPAEHAEAAVLLVVGPSGCGKSSLVRAGLLPVIAGEPGWATVPAILPGPHPVAALTRELAATAHQCGLTWSTADIRRRLGEGGLAELANDLLLAGLGPRRTHLLLVVDQFEELLTQAAPAERARFADLLRPALAGPVQVIGTLRPEFLDQLLADPDLASLPTRVHTLRPLQREALGAVIEGPARLAGIDVDEDLVVRLVASTDSGEALPLLAYTLAQLADGVHRGGRLRPSRYEQLGGVQGALTVQADAALADATAATSRSRDQVIRKLLRLVTVDEQGRPTRWRVRRNDLPTQVTAELDAFVARRLLTTDTENSETVIGVAHEAFLSAWPPLAAAITAAASGLRARRAVEQAAAEWVEDGHPSARLWEGGQLAAAVGATGARLVKRATPHELAASSGDPASPTPRPSRLRPRRHPAVVTDRVELSAPARTFLRASILRDRRQRRRGVTILSVLLVLALAAAGVAVVQQQTAEERQRVATARQLIAQSQSIFREDPRTALQLGEAALSIHDSPETRVALTNTLLGTRFRKSFESHTETLTSAAITPDGRTLVAVGSDDMAVVWDLADVSHPLRLGELSTGDIGGVLTMALAPDGRTLAIAGFDGDMILWKLTDRAGPERLGIIPTKSGGQVRTAAFGPDGRILATSSGGTVSLWGLTDPAHPTRLGDLIGLPRDSDTVRGELHAVSYAPNGRILATVGSNAFSNGEVITTTLLWDLTDTAHPTRLGDPLSGTVEFAPDGRTLATATKDDVTLWDATNPASPVRLGEPISEQTRGGAFAPDSRTLATIGLDGTATLWDLIDLAHRRKLSLPLTGREGLVRFTPDGQTLITLSTDRTVILWDLTDRGRPRQLGDLLTRDADAGNLHLAVSPDGRILATATWEKLRIWDLTDPGHPGPLGAPIPLPNYQILSMEFGPDGRTVATAGSKLNEGGQPPGPGIATLWDLTDPGHPIPLGELTGHEAIDELAFAPDGHKLATGSRDGTALLWDLTNPAQPRRLGEPFTPHDKRWVWAMAFTPDGQSLATASRTDDTTLLWDLTDPTHPTPRGDSLPGTIRAVAFAPDGRTLATTTDGDGNIILWDLSGPAHPAPLGPPLTGPADGIIGVALAPDGRTLAVASGEGRVILWDLSEPTHPSRLGDPDDSLIGPPGNGEKAGLAFSPDGLTLVSATTDRTTIWDLNGFNDLRTQPMEQACAITEHGLDQAQWARYISNLPRIDSCT